MKSGVFVLLALLWGVSLQAVTVRLAWDPNPANELVQKYEIYEQVGSALTKVDEVAGNVHQHDLTNVSSGVHYYVVIAVNITGSSQPSEPTPLGRLANLSTRGFVSTGARVMIGGFVVNHDGPTRVLLRGVGPSLAQFVNGTLDDPVLTLVDQAGNQIAQNDDWGDDPAIASVGTAVNAFPMEPGSKDAALLVVLNPGQYTVICSGSSGTEGIALVECYEAP